MLALVLNRLLEELFAAFEHVVDERLRDAMVPEIKEADVLARLSDLTGALCGVRGEETKVNDWDGGSVATSIGRASFLGAVQHAVVAAVVGCVGWGVEQGVKIGFFLSSPAFDGCSHMWVGTLWVEPVKK